MTIIKKFFKVLWLLSLLTLVFAYLQKDNLPSPGQIDSQLSQNPIQSEIKKADIQVQDGEFDYKITPKYNYELWGLVISQHDSRSWIDLYHKNDPFNIKDICVFWGGNVKSGVYEKMKFSSADWTCHYQFKDNISQDWWTKFNQNEGSNNHLLAANTQIAEKIQSTTIGDQVHLKGYLVNYTISQDGKLISGRNTSITRTDTSENNCEVVYVTDYEIIAPENVLFHNLFQWSGYALLFLSIVIIVLFFAPLKNVEE